ncbi:MAG TPA: hypothetical protein VG269_17480 [Tepidisphaeraceae bacterium]|nr:hypothetical protein [Tepidisphaeraceae bacterium]
MFGRKDIQRIGQAVRTTEKVTHLPSPEDYRRGSLPEFLVKITASNGATPAAYSWTKYYVNSSGVPTVWPGSTPPAGTANAYEANAFPCPMNVFVWLTYVGNNIYQFKTPAEIFPVKVSVSGGIAGSMSAGTTCSFTYTVYDETGTDVIASSLTPDVTRYSNCQYITPSAKSPGIAYCDSGGTVHLYSVAQERPTGTVVTNITDFQVVDGSQQLQVKTQTQLVLDAGTKSGWTTIYTGSTC